MPKKGQRRPWRLRFEWDSGVNGTVTFATEAGRLPYRVRALVERGESIPRAYW